VIKVVRGNPTPEELAAALAVVQSRAASAPAGDGAARPLDAWADPARTIPLRRVPRPGPAAWRSTYWPG
jgi:hypothetical protein